jgi:hypothetical protein
MDCLEPGGRLFTYKVKADRGTAPNPYGGVCSLAICKPKIRSAAKPGDIVVGFGCKNSSKQDEEFRIVYVMQVRESIDWKAYIKRCEEQLCEKIPTGAEHPGDCIYKLDHPSVRCESWSMHTDGDYGKDVERGKRVLLSYPDKFWYFGAGSQIELVLPKDFEGKNLQHISPMKQGHRSDRNDDYRDQFVRWFNKELGSRKIDTAGRYGYPNFPAPEHGPTKNRNAGISSTCSTGTNIRPIEPIDRAIASSTTKRQHGCR